MPHRYEFSNNANNAVKRTEEYEADLGTPSAPELTALRDAFKEAYGKW